eukprot:4928043-Pyramimonas_sp.AAC.1
MLDWHARSNVIGLARDRHGCSDHVPVFAQVAPGAGPPSLPRRVTSRPDFPELVDSVLSEYELSDDPFDRLQECKAAMFAARDALASQLYRLGPSDGRRKIAVFLRFMRAARAHKRAHLHACLHALPYLSNYYDFHDMFYLDYEGFHEYLRAPNADMISDMMINECTTRAGQIDDARQARMQALLRSWPVKRRKLATFAVGDPLDSAPPSIEQSAQNLAEHWGE